jgi:hypothetical protein
MIASPLQRGRGTVWKVEIWEELVGPGQNPTPTGEYLQKGKKFPNWSAAEQAITSHIDAIDYRVNDYDKRRGCWWCRKKYEDQKNLILWIRPV